MYEPFKTMCFEEATANVPNVMADEIQRRLHVDKTSWAVAVDGTPGEGKWCILRNSGEHVYQVVGFDCTLWVPWEQKREVPSDETV